MEIVELGALIVVGLEVRATFRGLWREVPRAWDVLFSRAAEIQQRTGTAFVDISVEVVDGIHRQVVGAEVAEAGGPVPEGMTALEIPAGLYVHHRHEGSVTAIVSAFENMHAWARAERLLVSDLKLDRGYTRGFHERSHDLYLGIAG